MKSHPIHPDISEFDRIDALPTIAEVLAALRQLIRAMFDALPLTWR